MEIVRQIYFCGVSGATAGCLAWFLVGQAEASRWTNIWTSAAFIGAGIGILLVLALITTRGIVERWSSRRLSENLLIGVFAGGIAGAIGLLIGQSLFISIDMDWTGRMVGWVSLSLLLGLGQVGRDRSSRRLIVGAAAGLTSGVLCGLFYEGVTFAFIDASEKAQMWASGIGLIVVGAAFGAGIPLAERIASRAVVVVRSGIRAGSEYMLLDRLTVGSGENCRIMIPDDAQVEPHHLDLVIQGDKIEVKNLGLGEASLDGTTVTSGRSLQCRVPAVLRLGATELNIV